MSPPSEGRSGREEAKRPPKIYLIVDLKMVRFDAFPGYVGDRDREYAAQSPKAIYMYKVHRSWICL